MKKNILHELNEKTPGHAMQFIAPLNPTIQRAKTFQKTWL
jgi:hypothetical protein